MYIEPLDLMPAASYSLVHRNLAFNATSLTGPASIRTAIVSASCSVIAPAARCARKAIFAALIAVISALGAARADAQAIQYFEVDGNGSFNIGHNCSASACQSTDTTTGSVQAVFSFDPALYSQYPSGMANYVGPVTGTPWITLLSATINGVDVTSYLKEPPPNPPGALVATGTEFDAYSTPYQNTSIFEGGNQVTSYFLQSDIPSISFPVTPSSNVDANGIAAVSAAVFTPTLKVTNGVLTAGLPFYESLSTDGDLQIYSIGISNDYAGSTSAATGPEYSLASPITSSKLLSGPPGSISLLHLVDPYLLIIPSSGELAVNTVIESATKSTVQAKGLVADGTSATIAVAQSTALGPVTFAATNGALVAPYSPDFLKNASTRGAAKVTVAPTKIGQSYYALALVIGGTPPQAEIGLETKVTASTSNPTTTKSDSMLTVPTPVVLIHGLWGDATSLGSTGRYLRSLSGVIAGNPYLVKPICYSTYLTFDAAADDLPGHGTGCELTSAQALESYLKTLYKDLNDDQYVGGRVDVVGHSMGGLVARHFASTSSYKSVYNRNLGAFRNVITIDTPETGSALASFLDSSAKRILQATDTTSNPYHTWKAFCGLKPPVDVRTCFANRDLPLAYSDPAGKEPSQPLDTGAIASLIPNGHSIESAPPPTIFNTAFGKWYAIASDFPDADKPPSLLRILLNNVIAATYPGNEKAPTLSSILGTTANDVIVTVDSQTAGAIEAQTKKLKYLAHTSVPYGNGVAFLAGDSNASVTQSSAVNEQVGRWLGLAGNSSAVHETPAAAPQQESERPADLLDQLSGKTIFAAPERLSAQSPSSPVSLAQPFRLPLSIHGQPPLSISLRQISARQHNLVNSLGGRQIGSEQAKIVGGSPTEPTIEIVPLQAGAVDLEITALFADGGLAERDVQLDVAPSAQHLERFELDGGFTAVPLVLSDNEADNQAWLSPTLQYDTLRESIYLDSSAQLTLTVDQPDDAPVIRVDANGMIHALRPGRATITGAFDGISDTVKVEVYSEENAPPWYRRAQ